MSLIVQAIGFFFAIRRTISGNTTSCARGGNWQLFSETVTSYQKVTLSKVSGHQALFRQTQR